MGFSVDGFYMEQDLLVALGLSLATTLVLEAGFFLLIGKRNKKDLLLVILVNVLTNPVVVLLYWLSVMYTVWDRTLVKIPLEFFAVATEWLYYKKYASEIRRPFIFSLSANVFSFGIGMLLQQLL